MTIQTIDDSNESNVIWENGEQNSGDFHPASIAVP